MPEYLTPGVYVEETSFRSRSIEGVATSTCGMAGATRFGPVPYTRAFAERDVPRSVTMVPEPTLVTSMTEYERAYGDLERVFDLPNYLGFAARALFAQGGRRLYVSRVVAREDGGEIPAARFAVLPVPAEDPVLRWHARWPGRAGGETTVAVRFQRSKNVLVGGNLVGVQPGAVVEERDLEGDPLQPPRVPDLEQPDLARLKVVRRGADGRLGYEGDAGVVVPTKNTAAFHLRLTVSVQCGGRNDTYSEMELDREHARSIFRVLDPEEPVDDLALVWLQEVGPAPGAPPRSAADLLRALLSVQTPTFLVGGEDGPAPGPRDLEGGPADPDALDRPATGLSALGEVEDIAIVAMPDTVRFTTFEDQKTSVDSLIRHCEAERYRIAVVDPPANSSISDVRGFRSKFDSSYAALYYPWVEIVDPTARPEPGAPPVRLALPPSGYVAGIYARDDIARGVHKAPANEVVSGITRFLTNVIFDRQSVLNPEGINALRFFEGRSNRVWGARTMSSDPEWKYVNVRRLFIYLEHSIERSTQWAVFEPNNERLWASIRQSVEDFLLATWRTGALMGTKPEEAYFVRCDRTTMTQNDLDNGRLICLIGVAPTYPAEFAIFRIGQWTADAQRS